MRMQSRVRIERPDGWELRFESHTVQGKDVGTLQAAMWNPDLADWELVCLTREEVQVLRNYLSLWLGEDN